MILLHPMMPFVTEELWGLTGTRDTLCAHADWPAYGDELDDPEAMRELRWVIGLIEEIRSTRAQMGVPVGLKLPLLVIGLDDGARAALDRNGALIERLARIEGMHPAESLPKGALTVAVEGGTFGLPLGDVIDIAAETARLDKARAKLDKEIAGLRGRVMNPKFAESAPPEVVEETREALTAREDEAAKLAAAIARLKALA